MSRAASGEFGGERPPASDGIVSFDVRRPEGDDQYRCVGGEPNFDRVGKGPTAALAIADYCRKYHEATTVGGRD